MEITDLVRFFMARYNVLLSGGLLRYWQFNTGWVGIYMLTLLQSCGCRKYINIVVWFSVWKITKEVITRCLLQKIYAAVLERNALVLLLFRIKQKIISYWNLFILLGEYRVSQVGEEGTNGSAACVFLNGVCCAVEHLFTV